MSNDWGPELISNFSWGKGSGTCPVKRSMSEKTQEDCLMSQRHGKYFLCRGVCVEETVFIPGVFGNHFLSANMVLDWINLPAFVCSVDPHEVIPTALPVLKGVNFNRLCLEQMGQDMLFSNWEPLIGKRPDSHHHTSRSRVREGTGVESLYS
jgi:hypothetical protein